MSKARTVAALAALTDKVSMADTRQAQLDAMWDFAAASWVEEHAKRLKQCAVVIDHVLREFEPCVALLTLYIGAINIERASRGECPPEIVSALRRIADDIVDTVPPR